MHVPDYDKNHLPDPNNKSMTKGVVKERINIFFVKSRR